MEFSGQNTGVGSLPFSRDLPNPGIEPGSLALQADSLPAEPQGKPISHTDIHYVHKQILLSVLFQAKF